jgi:hypothetical protein
MGYGINLLTNPTLYLLDGLKGKYADCHIETMRRTDEATLELARISHYTFIFMNECKTLFKYCEDEDEDDDCWDRIYTWRNKYRNMEWEELELIIKELIETFATTQDKYFTEDLKTECLEDLKTLFSVIDIAKTFQIY